MAPPVFPVQQFTILALCRFAEPLSMLSILPYLPEMVESFGVPKNNIALWSGIVAGCYSGFECMAAVPWSMLSDHWGRKPVVLMSLTITMVMTLVWGFSTTLWMALTARILTGAGNGVAGIIRTMVAELCPWKELQPIAFSIMPIVWNMGSIIGPLIGGAFSNPYHRAPGSPAGPHFFEKFPYALPNLIAACIFLAGIVTGALFLRETHPHRSGRKDIGLIIGEKLTSAIGDRCSSLRDLVTFSKEEECSPLLESSSSPDCESIASSSADVETCINTKDYSKVQPAVTWRDVLSRQTCYNLVAYGLLCMHSMSYDQLLPVFMHHPVQSSAVSALDLPFKFSGGFGIETSRISIMFTMYGIGTMCFQLFVYPPLVRRFGTLTCFKACSIVFPFVYFISPFSSLLSSTNHKQGALLFVWLLNGLCSNISFPSATILLINSVSKPQHMARLNGVAVVVSSVGRAFGPAMIGPLFTLGADVGYIVIPFWTLSAITAFAIIPVFCLRPDHDDDESDDDESEDDESDDYESDDEE